MSENGSHDFEAARLVTEKLESLKAEYEAADGSNGKTMHWVRSRYSEIVPYSSKNWFKQWSKYATDLISLDKAKNRPIFVNEGPVPTVPLTSNEDQVYVFDLSNNPVFPADVPRSRHSSHGSNRRRSQSRNVDNEIRILTQEEIDNAQRARNILDQQSGLGRSKSFSPVLLRSPGTKDKGHRSNFDEEDVESDIKKQKMEKGWEWTERVGSGPSAYENCSESAIAFSKAVRGYAPNLSKAVEGFNDRVKPANFPSNLSKDLLQGKYIDLRRVKGEFLAEKKGMATNFMVTGGKDKDISLQSKKIVSCLEDVQDWFYYFDTLEQAYQEAFPHSYIYFCKYLAWIKEEFMSSVQKADWVCVANFDEALWSEFAMRRDISFADWNHPSLGTIRTRLMSKAFEPKQPVASTSGRQASGGSGSYQRPFQKRLLTSPNRPPRDSPNFYKPSYKHKGLYEVEDGYGKEDWEQFCFAHNLGVCSKGNKCPRMHRCNVKGCRKDHKGCNHPGP
ncbi:hypothetical protein DFH28DRAFT_939243 [Melampsora americana]|nr:hypothetical protein DFH28DRAFT_939243 [Melampsora americana]